LILLLLMSVQSFKTVDADKNNQMCRCKKKNVKAFWQTVVKIT
jgi:hypothetical protein